MPEAGQVQGRSQHRKSRRFWQQAACMVLERQNGILWEIKKIPATVGWFLFGLSLTSPLANLRISWSQQLTHLTGASLYFSPLLCNRVFSTCSVGVFIPDKLQDITEPKACWMLLFEVIILCSWSCWNLQLWPPDRRKLGEGKPWSYWILQGELPCQGQRGRFINLSEFLFIQIWLSLAEQLKKDRTVFSPVDREG